MVVQTGNRSIGDFIGTGRGIADNTSGSTGGVAKPGGATPTPHFTPLSIEKLFTGGSLGADFNRGWQFFQKEVVTNTLLISHDLQSAWNRLQQAVRKVLRGRAN